MKIGVSSYSFSQYISTGKLDNVSVIAKAHEMGFDGIEYTTFLGMQEEKLDLALKLRREAERLGMDIPAYCVSADFICKTPESQRNVIDSLKFELDVAKTLGAPLMRHDVMWKLERFKSFDMALGDVVEAIRDVADYGKTLGIKTMFENHGTVLQDMDRVEKLYNAVSHDNFGMLVDIGNYLCTDQDNVKCVSRFASLASHVHLKDFKIHNFYDEVPNGSFFRTRERSYLIGVPVGEGDARALQCLEILKAQGYDGYLCIEYEGAEDCIQGVQRGLNFYRNWETKNL